MIFWFVPRADTGAGAGGVTAERIGGRPCAVATRCAPRDEPFAAGAGASGGGGRFGESRSCNLYLGFVIRLPDGGSNITQRHNQ